MEQRLIKKKSIGELLLQAGKLRPEDADRVLREQRLSGLRFGDAAIKLKLVTQSDIDEVLSMQFDFSVVDNSNNVVDPKVFTAYSTQTRETEYFRSLRGQLAIRWLSENQMLAISSVRGKAGTTLVAANLAVSFAQLGERVLLVDANMRTPKIHEYFKLKNTKGFSDYLANRADLSCIENFEQISGLSIMTSGAIPPNPLELIGRGGLKKLISEVKGQFDIVLFDTPALKEHCDAISILNSVKGGLLVIRKNVTLIDEINEVNQEFDLAGASMIGIVMNHYS